MEQLLEATGENNLSHYGVHWIKRKTGTAMGKSESPLKAEIVFSDEEKRRLAKRKLRIREGFLQDHEDINEVVNGVRYVDDLLLFSCLLCVS